MLEALSDITACVVYPFHLKQGLNFDFSCVGDCICMRYNAGFQNFQVIIKALTLSISWNKWFQYFDRWLNALPTVERAESDYTVLGISLRPLSAYMFVATTNFSA
jgi:hypothetical protein